MNRRIPATETLELILALSPDGVNELRLSQASRDELFQHMSNLAVVLAEIMPDADARQVGAALNAAWLHGPARDGWEALGEPDVIA